MGERHRRFDLPVDEQALARDGGYLLWTSTPPDRALLARRGFHVVDYARARQEHFAPALNAGTKRSTLDNPAQRWLDLLDEHPKVALVDVPLRTLADLRVVHGLIVEPCLAREEQRERRDKPAWRRR